MRYFVLFVCLLWHNQTFCQTYRVRNQVNHAQGPLSISPDNQLIVLASETSIMADIWDVRTGQFITSVQLPDTLIQNTLRYDTHVCFGWQNNLLIGLSKKKEFWIYDWQLNKTVGKITGPINHSTEYIFSKNRKLLALKNNQDKKVSITIVDCVSGKQKTVLQLPANRFLVVGAQSLLFSPDQKEIYVAVDKEESLAFDVETGAFLRMLPIQPLIIDAKTKEYYGCKNGQILVGTIDNSQSVSLFGKAQNDNASSRFSLSPDGNLLAESNPVNGPIRLWDRTKKEIVGQVDSYNPQIFTFINNTTLLCDEKQIRYRNIQKNDERSLAQDNHVYDVRFGGSGSDVWISKKKAKLFKFSIDSIACFTAYDFDGLSTDLFDINKSGSRLVLNHGSGWVRLFDVKTMAFLKKSTIGLPEQATNESVDLLRFSPNQKYIGVVYSDKIGFRLLNADNMSVKWAFKPLESRSFVSDSYPFSFSGDSRSIAVLFGKSIGVFDVATGVQSVLGFAHDGSTQAQFVHFSPDGKTIAHGQNGELRFLNVAKKEVIKTFKDLNMYFAFTNSNGGGIYSPDGSLFAYATSSRTIKLVDLGTFEVVKEFGATDGAVKDITFSPNGKLLLAADQSGCIKFWDVAKGKALLNACVFKNLSDWIVYTPDGQVDGTPFGISQLYEVSSGEIRIISNAEAKRKPGLFYQVLKAYK